MVCAPDCGDDCDLPECVLNPIPGDRKHWLQLKQRWNVLKMKQISCWGFCFNAMHNHLYSLGPDLDLLEGLKERHQKVHLAKILKFCPQIATSCNHIYMYCWLVSKCDNDWEPHPRVSHPVFESTMSVINPYIPLVHLTKAIQKPLYIYLLCYEEWRLKMALSI